MTKSRGCHIATSQCHSQYSNTGLVCSPCHRAISCSNRFATAARKRLKVFQACLPNAELSIPNSGSRPSLAARWVDDGGDGGMGARGRGHRPVPVPRGRQAPPGPVRLGGWTTGGCGCGGALCAGRGRCVRVGSRHPGQGGGFTRDRGAWLPPDGLLCGDAGDSRPGGQAVPHWCIEGASRHGRPAPPLACTWMPRRRRPVPGPGAQGPARLGGRTTAGMRARGCAVDIFVVMLVRERRWLASCPGYRLAGGSIDALAGSSTYRPGCCAYLGSATGRMDAPTGLRLPHHPLLASGSPLRFRLPI